MADSIVLTLDVADLDVQTAFWCGALGYEHKASVVQYRALVDPAGRWPKMLLQQVSEAKSSKNRLHLDLHVVDPAVEAARLEALGATIRAARGGVRDLLDCDGRPRGQRVLPRRRRRRRRIARRSQPADAPRHGRRYLTRSELRRSSSPRSSRRAT
jgi:hypothetical protein